jgi:hypothetical protein
MTQLIDLGKLRFNFSGDWVSSTEYEINDVVKYGGNAYVYSYGLKTSGNLPTNTTYWKLMVEGINFLGNWSDSTAYKIGDSVSYGGVTYIALADSTNAEPDTTPVKWSKFVDGIQFAGDYNPASTYQPNDVVVYGGSSFIALVTVSGVTPAIGASWASFAAGVRWRGSWTTATSYLPNDVVADGVSTYIATQAHTSGAGFAADFAANKFIYFAKGAADILPVIGANQAGFAAHIGPNGTNLAWLNATGSQNVFYVAPGGADTNPGTSLALPFASIQKAVSVVPDGQPATIFVKTGTYSEAALPIVVPANTAIVGDSQRTVVVQPAPGLAADGVTPNAESSLFLMSNGSILNKMTFKGMTGWVPGTTADNITTSTIKGVVVRMNPASPITTKSPYVLECAFIGSGAIGALIDGTTHGSGAKTMIFHGYTVISDNGVGYWVKDGGKAEIVSCFTYYCYFGYTASGGGFIRSLNGNNSYGTWGATSRGYDQYETPVTGSVYGQQMNFLYGGGNINVGDTVTSSGGGTATVTNVQTTANKVYVTGATGTFVLGNTLTFTSGGTGTVSAGAVENQKGFIVILNNLTGAPTPGQSISINGDTYSYVIQSVQGTWVDSSSVVAVVLAQEKPTGSASGAAATLRSVYSQVRLTGHDFLSIGTGGIATTNYPGTPTQPAAQGNEVDEAYPGRVYYVSTDQNGNFRVGEYFRIDQATGRATLNASAFDLAGLTSLRLGSIGAQLGETINEFSSDGTLSGNSNVAVPTEQAVKTYVDTYAVILGDTSAVTISTTTTYSDRQFRAVFNSGAGTVVWSIVGTAPSGMTISSSGLLSNGNGTVPAGTYNFSIRAASGNLSVSKTISIISSASVPVFSTSTFPTLLTPSQAFTINAATATVGSGTIAYTVSTGTLPSGMTLNASTGVISGTAPASSSTAVPFSFTVSATCAGFTTTKSFSGSLYYFIVQGQSLYGTNVGTGTFTWIAPTGVSSVSAVAIGGGHGGSQQWSYGGGAGGGLGWKNNITVVPGSSYTVVVGASGTIYNGPNYYDENSVTAAPGGNSYFINYSTVAGQGGGRSSGDASGVFNSTRNISNDYGYSGGGYIGNGGGRGGNINSSWTTPGAGCGGYSGNGGCISTGRYVTYGGGMGGYYSSTYGTGGGGGVGLYGDTGSDRYGQYVYTPWSGYTTDYSYAGGGGGHGPGGENGYWGENPWSGQNQSGGYGIRGGTYGGGGGGSGTSNGGGPGGQGGVRIIWGSGRSFPGTNTADVTVQALP